MSIESIKFLGERVYCASVVSNGRTMFGYGFDFSQAITNLLQRVIQ